MGAVQATAKADQHRRWQSARERIIAAAVPAAGRRVAENYEVSPLLPEGPIEHIVREVCAYYDVRPLDVLSSRRTRNLVRPRHVIMYLATETTVKSLPQIGQRMRRDHTTVHHGRQAVVKRMAADPSFAAEVEALVQLVSPPKVDGGST